MLDNFFSCLISVELLKKTPEAQQEQSITVDEVICIDMSPFHKPIFLLFTRNVR